MATKKQKKRKLKYGTDTMCGVCGNFCEVLEKPLRIQCTFCEAWIEARVVGKKAVRK